ncbi:hypothetical protein B0H17DRAFT_1178129 [Mycena rosella]|uniref:Uncharacterized protein n=1 Tax=Mycena rosella TaxID=1033263 RepID=A0AAD7DQW9_MYCRO|nr:hypothetical protein B0H17DRAFT_1178129 [Mycena rosella]
MVAPKAASGENKFLRCPHLKCEAPPPATGDTKYSELWQSSTVQICPAHNVHPRKTATCQLPLSRQSDPSSVPPLRKTSSKPLFEPSAHYPSQPAPLYQALHFKSILGIKCINVTWRSHSFPRNLRTLVFPVFPLCQPPQLHQSTPALHIGYQACTQYDCHVVLEIQHSRRDHSHIWGVGIIAFSAEACTRRLWEAASREREVIRMNILPVRFPAEYIYPLKRAPTGPGTPSTGLATPQPVVPSTSDSQLLPLDPEAIDHPNKTLVTPSATGIISGLTTAQRKEQHEDDAPSTLPATWCSHHSTSCWPDWARRRWSTSSRSSRKWLALNSTRRSRTPYSPADRPIDNRYWLSRLAEAALKPAVDVSLLVLDYFPTPAEKLPEQEQHGYNKTRKYDAFALLQQSDRVAKYQQAIINTDDLLTFQPTRLFVPTLSFHGKGENTELFLNQERLEFAVVDDGFKSDNFPTISALLHLFRTASMFQLGYNPLFTYIFSSPPSNFSVGDAVPASVVLPGFQAPVRLNGKRLSQLRSTPFQRSTFVLEGELHEDDNEPTPVVVKPDPTYAPKLLAAFAAHGSSPVNPSEILRTGQKRMTTHLTALSEVMIFASPREARKLGVSSATKLLAAAKQLFLAILDAFRRDRPTLRGAVAGQGTVIGTLDTMSVASLNNNNPLPHDDVESAIYVFLKLLTQIFVPPLDKQDEWATILHSKYWWDDPDVDPQTLGDLRMGLWTGHHIKTSAIAATLQIFQSAGRMARAQLVVSLLSLPLPMQLADSSDYETVLS